MISDHHVIGLSLIIRNRIKLTATVTKYPGPGPAVYMIHAFKISEDENSSTVLFIVVYSMLE